MNNPANAPAHVVDIDVNNFAHEVMDASRTQLVMVDFWADWCAPCRNLTPILEKLVAQYDGALKLAKVNADANQELAAHFGVRSLPNVFFFHNAQPVDQFAGALGEAEIKRIIDKYIAPPVGAAIDQARALFTSGDIKAGMSLAKQLMQAMPGDDAPKLLLMEMHLAQNQLTDAEKIAAALSEAGKKQPAALALAAQLEFQDAPDADVNALRQTIESNPNDLDARWQLANALTAARQYEAALQQLLEVIKQNRNYRDDAARKLMIKIFQMCGGQGELVAKYRRMLTSALT